mmetsp:Transcript_1106/g.1466  ORF Transcript_1106/g.1466 Transcript_1106/m.1466 type:complete len:147 (-) Transcript_1106:272-712(-)
MSMNPMKATFVMCLQMKEKIFIPSFVFMNLQLLLLRLHVLQVRLESKKNGNMKRKKARESLYTRATWRMYDRITSARNAQILTHARPSTVGLRSDPLIRNETNNGQLSFKNAVHFSPPSKHVHDYEANMHSPVGSPYHAVFQLSLD